MLTGEYPIDFNSLVEHGYKSKNLYRSTSSAVCLPSKPSNYKIRQLISQ